MGKKQVFLEHSTTFRVCCCPWPNSFELPTFILTKIDRCVVKTKMKAEIQAGNDGEVRSTGTRYSCNNIVMTRSRGLVCQSSLVISVINR